MPSDIYNIPNWATSTVYEKNDIVLTSNNYYYASQRHTSDGSSFTTDLNNGLWDGIISYGGEQKPYFFWEPSYDYTVDSNPRVKTVQFGDGYSQDIKDGINNILLKINFNFNGRDLKEHRAILHFFHQRAGKERFFFIPPQPYGIVKKFICKEWQPSQSFVDNYNIRARFEERAI
jgi:phage-related protein